MTTPTLPTAMEEARNLAAIARQEGTDWSAADVARVARALNERDGRENAWRDQRKALLGDRDALLAQLREREREHMNQLAALKVTWEAKEREVERLREALDILTRACEAGAYVGKTSPAVIQARHHLTRRPAPEGE